MNMTVEQTDYDDALGPEEQLDFVQVEGTNVTTATFCMETLRCIVCHQLNMRPHRLLDRCLCSTSHLSANLTQRNTTTCLCSTCHLSSRFYCSVLPNNAR